MAVSGHAVWQYQVALVALGAGWNFLFIGGTTLIASRSDERDGPRLQGINDFVVFAAMASASLSAGNLLHNLGWAWTNLTALLLLALITAMLLRR